MRKHRTPARFFATAGIIILVLIAATSLSHAEDMCLVRTPQDVLDCVLHKHPDVVNARAEKFRDEQLITIAKQRPNPELESRILARRSADNTNFNTEISVLHTLELGGKRRSRIGQATVLAEKSGIEVTRNREDVALQTVLALYRLRQIQSELGGVDETLATFGTILFTFTSRPNLSPEQSVSRASFSLAREDYKLKKVSLLHEQANLLAWLEVATGISSQSILRHLPPPKSTWPHVPASLEPDTLSNATVELARADKNLAEKNVSIAQSKAWPDLKIGPSVDTESLDNGGRRWSGGVNVSVPLPIVSLNRGEKAFAKADQLRAQTNLELAIRKTASERSLQLKRYHAAIKALRSSQSVSRLAAEHQNIEDFFDKGLVSSTLVIETHRQLYDITQTRHEQELTSVDALWRLYILDGRLMEEKI